MPTTATPLIIAPGATAEDLNLTPEERAVFDCLEALTPDVEEAARQLTEILPYDNPTEMLAEINAIVLEEFHLLQAKMPEPFKTLGPEFVLAGIEGESIEAHADRAFRRLSAATALAALGESLATLRIEAQEGITTNPLDATDLALLD